MQDLEKLDVIRDRLGVSYKEAQEALQAAGGDVVKALILLEEKGGRIPEKLQVQGNKVMKSVRKIVSKGQETKVKVLKNGETVLEFPATYGALGLLGMLASPEIALLAALGTITGWPISTPWNSIKKTGRKTRECDL